MIIIKPVDQVKRISITIFGIRLEASWISKSQEYREHPEEALRIAAMLARREKRIYGIYFQTNLEKPLVTVNQSVERGLYADYYA